MSNLLKRSFLQSKSYTHTSLLYIPHISAVVSSHLLITGRPFYKSNETIYGFVIDFEFPNDLNFVLAANLPFRL